MLYFVNIFPPFFSKFLIYLIFYGNLLLQNIKRGEKMAARLKFLRKKMKLTRAEFAKYLGITQTAYSMIENGYRPLSPKYIKVICSVFNVSERWLKDGQGEMYHSSPYEKELIAIYDNLSEASQQYLLLMAKELLKTQELLLSSVSEK